MSFTDKLFLNLFVAIFKKKNNTEHNSLDSALVAATQPPYENTEKNEIVTNF